MAYTDRRERWRNRVLIQGGGVGSSSDSELDPLTEKIVAFLALGLVLLAVAWIFLVVLVAGYILAQLVSVYQVHGSAGKPKAQLLKRAWQVLLGAFAVALLFGLGGAEEAAISIVFWSTGGYVLFVLALGYRLDPPRIRITDPTQPAIAELDSYLLPFDPDQEALQPIAAPQPAEAEAERAITPFVPWVKDVFSQKTTAENPEETFSAVKTLLQTR